MAKLTMPKATANWLIDNTALTFEQIADFCELHIVEIEAMADQEVSRNIIGENPIMKGFLKEDEIKRCEADPTARLELAFSNLPKPAARTKGPKYTPLAKRGDKPDAIAWLVKNHPELSDAQICKLVGTTKPTIEAIRSRSHANIANIRPRNPVEIGLVKYDELENALKKAQKKAAKNNPITEEPSIVDTSLDSDETQNQASNF